MARFMTNQNKWMDPYLVLFQPLEGNYARILAKEFKVT